MEIHCNIQISTSIVKRNTIKPLKCNEKFLFFLTVFFFLQP